MTRLERHVTRWATVAAAALVLAVVRPGWAGTAGTGTFDIDFNGFPPNVTFDGDLAFGNDPRDVGGTSVNLGTDVGTIPYTGSAVVNLNALSATFDINATNGAGFGFMGNGYGACTTACLGGTATFVGIISSLTDTAPLLPAGYAYTFDGTVSVDIFGMGPGGTFAMNAFPNVATPAGANVVVQSGLESFINSKTLNLSEFLVELVYTAVNTPGFTSFLGVTAVPGTLPPGVELIPDESVFVDIKTDAGFTPPVEVCVAYTDADMDGVVDGTSITVAQLRLLHQQAIGGPFADVTTTATDGVVCGEVMSLSPFVVAAGPLPTTTTITITTTTLVPTTTTTTTLPELLPGKKLLLKDKDGKPQKRAINVLVKAGVTLGAGNGSADDPTQSGGSLRVMSAGFDDTYDLPAGSWKTVGKAGAGKGYKAKKAGSIKSVLVKPGKLIKVIAKGSGLGHSLATNPDPVAVILELGGHQYCMRFGGGTFKDGKKYLAKDTGTPTECGVPTGSASGAFLD